MRVTLVLPANDERRSSAISQAGAEHLGLGCIASYLRSLDHSVTILNFQVNAYLSFWEALDGGRLPSIDECVAAVLATDPEVVGMSVTGITIAEAIGMSRGIKQARPSVRVVWGGHQAYQSAHDILVREESVDVIVASDGELTMGRLLEAYAAGAPIEKVPGIYIRRRPARGKLLMVGGNKDSAGGDGRTLFTGEPPEPPLDEFPFPARDTLEDSIRRGARVTDARISTSRGCPFKCTFCVDPSLGYRKKWRARSAERVVAEMKMLVERYGIQFFWFSEDNFIPPTQVGRSRGAEIARRLIEANLGVGYRALLRADAIDGHEDLVRDLVRSGMTCVYIGVESGSPRRLAYFKKHEEPEHYERVVRMLNGLRVGLQIGFIMFDPLTSWEDLQIDARFLHRIRQMYLYSNFCQVLDVFPGTEMATMLIERGLLDPGFTYDSPYDKYDYEIPAVGVVARACQRGYGDALVELDKYFQRLSVVDVPRLHRLNRDAPIPGAGTVLARVDEAIAAVNDRGLEFFERMLELGQSGYSNEAFAALLSDHVAAVQTARERLQRDLHRMPAPARAHLSAACADDTRATPLSRESDGLTGPAPLRMVEAAHVGPAPVLVADCP